MSYNTIPPNTTLKITPFKAHVSDTDLTHFTQLLKLSRLSPKTYENLQPSTLTYGVTHAWMSSTKTHWETNYSWRAREDRINSFPNFTTQIVDDDDTFTIHFAALFSNKADAVPITFLHGWPGSFLEFLGVLSLFRDKYTPDTLPYHIIVPSLPGYGYSSGPPPTKNFTTGDIARIINTLMTGLGFTSYIAQGGDIGSYTCRHLAKYPTCKAIHLNFSMMSSAPDGVDESKIDEIDRQGLKQASEFSATQSAYALEHGTRPSTIGFVCSSSPLALLAWIGEKFLTWTDVTPSIDDILDNITLYWFTESMPRCIFPYREYHFSTKEDWAIHGDPGYFVEKMLGYSYFPRELAPMPREWVQRTGNLVWYRRHEGGGHFAALERPELMVGDIEDFVKEVWD